MSPLAHSASWGLAPVVGLALALVLLPRPLFAEAGSARPSRAVEIGLGSGLALVGLVTFFALPAAPPAEALALAAALMVLAAVAYSDIRYLVIPDLYSAILVALALVGPLAPGLGAAIFGALLAGGLLAVVAWAWRRSTKVEGLGFGDVKLAAALGALLGAEDAMWTIAGSALVAGAIAFLMRLARPPKPDEGPPMIPYGAALSLFGGALLVWSRL